MTRKLSGKNNNYYLCREKVLYVGVSTGSTTLGFAG